METSWCLAAAAEHNPVQTEENTGPIELAHVVQSDEPTFHRPQIWIAPSKYSMRFEPLQTTASPGQLILLVSGGL